MCNKCVKDVKKYIIKKYQTNFTLIPKEGIGDILHLETHVGTGSNKYGLLTATVLTVYAPVTDGVRQDMTRTYGRN